MKIVDTKGNSVPQGERGEVCFRGRHTFMGYLKNPEATRATKDAQGYVHSGDEGYLDEQGYLFITGRFKELIITAGGENIPPVPIEQAIKDEAVIVSNAFLIGEAKKYLTILLTLKNVAGSDGNPTDELTQEVIRILQEGGSSSTTISQAMRDPLVHNIIQDAINRVNARATSNAQKVQKFMILPNDFSIAGGELTATMKVQRKKVEAKYENEIMELYTDPRL